MAACIRYDPPVRSLSHAEHTVPWIRSVQFVGVHMEQEESGDEIELSGVAGVYCAVSTLGFDGIQFGVAWYGAEGRDLWGDCWT